MIKLSDAPFELYGFKAKDFFDWCKKKKKPNYAISSRKEFFSLLHKGLIKKENGKMMILEEKENVSN